MHTGDIEGIERATLAAVPPEAMRELDGWLVPLDRGTVGRAHSAVPLSHDASAGAVPAIEACYAAYGTKPFFRIARAAGLQALGSTLAQSGYAASKPTCVEVAAAADVAAGAAASSVRLSPSVEPSWTAVFLGEGFDPVDGESRSAILKRGRSSLFASVEVDGEVVAVGSACYSHGWCGIHGMRTLPAQRGRGHASRILAALASAARERGIERVFLQVEQGNPARALYRRAGFREAWIYDYWARTA